MTPDFERLCEAAERARDGADTTQAIVRAVLTELREVGGLLSEQIASHFNEDDIGGQDMHEYLGSHHVATIIDIALNVILAEPATA